MIKNSRVNPVKPSLDEVTKWAGNSWEKINNEIVQKLLKISYLHPEFNWLDTTKFNHVIIGLQIDTQSNNNVAVNEIDVSESDKAATVFE